jgi:hypothetical protein
MKGRGGPKWGGDRTNGRGGAAAAAPMMPATFAAQLLALASSNHLPPELAHRHQLVEARREVGELKTDKGTLLIKVIQLESDLQSSKKYT